jgi:hypothetical protein
MDATKTKPFNMSSTLRCKVKIEFKLGQKHRGNRTMLSMLSEPEVEIGPGRTNLDLLQAIYRTAELPLHVRMKAAMAALPYEHPKLAVTAVLDGTDDLGARLHRAIQRTAKVIELRAEAPRPAPHDAAAVSAAAVRTPLVSYRRR